MLHASQVCLARGFKKAEEMVPKCRNSALNYCISALIIKHGKVKINVLHASLVCIARGFKKAKEMAPKGSI